MMSDGLPDRFNCAGEQFGEEVVKDHLARAGSLTPDEIIECLVTAGEAWASGCPQEDDITFVVFQLKPVMRHASRADKIQ